MDRLLQQPVVDSFIDAFNAAGVWLEPAVTQITGTLSTLAAKHLPDEAQALLSDLNRTLLSLRSPYALRLPLMDPMHVVLIIVAYLVVVFTGMLVMSALPRMNVNLLAMVHNTAMVSLSAYMMGGIIYEAVINNYVVWGNPVDYSEKGWPMAKMVWLFYVSKIFEFVDTLIMVLKKNNRQISFLHVYHHTSVFAIWWMVTYVAPGGESYFSSSLNSFIHVVMYGYYLLSSMGIKQVSFIKRYITAMQMTQFCCMMAQASYLLVHPNPFPEGKEPYPRAIAVVLFWYMWTMLGLFANFFVKDRMRAAEARKAGKEGKVKKQ
ncbi:hypothetical protein HDU67_008429 [Dinochytrium kinnereticum]|nr:hypothetical protein HDU67_008429 [Dinochytrium kinnereticum]